MIIHKFINPCASSVSLLLNFKDFMYKFRTSAINDVCKDHKLLRINCKSMLVNVKITRRTFGIAFECQVSWCDWALNHPMTGGAQYPLFVCVA